VRPAFDRAIGIPIFSEDLKICIGVYYLVVTKGDFGWLTPGPDH